MPPLKLYNTLTRKVEEFQPLYDNEVRMYTCGPTVYDYAHIGNLRTYIFEDVLRRTLEYNGYRVIHVMNITDVGHLTSDADFGEDKMLVGARRARMTVWEIAQMYTEAFFRDIHKLNIKDPTIVCKATDHIPEMIALIQRLIERGHAYQISDGVYYDVTTFPEYGKLSRLDLQEQQVGAREEVKVNPEKRHPADFALWKIAEPEHIMQWDSPWGRGYPGWHIECSAMSMKYLGETFDIHCGGVDHIPIHHENEIAQSEGATGKPFVRYWLHGEFLLVDGGKMSKSLGNVYTLSDLEARGFTPLGYRYFCYSAHYRSKLNFTWDAMKAAQAGLDHLHSLIVQMEGDGTGELSEEYRARFHEAINDDLNVPAAMAIVWELVKSELPDPVKKATLFNMDQVLALRFDRAREELDLPPDLEEKLRERQAARAARNWAVADRIREELAAQGIELEDTKQGTRWRRKRFYREPAPAAPAGAPA
jgi:cysteinyl-tRNA synthetase